MGVDVLPDSDLLNGAYAEIIPKISYTKLEDSIVTSNITNSNLLGSINDPVFGRFDASIYMNFEITANGLGATLGTNPELDSVVLMLQYNTLATIPFIGDSTHPLSLDVYPLTQKMNRDSTYYSARRIGYDANENLVEGGQSRIVNHKPYSSVLINKDDATPDPHPQIRVRLKKEFGEKLFNLNYLTSLSAFQNAFYGLHITTANSILPQPNYGSVFYFNMLSSRVLLYYHNDAQSKLSPIEVFCGANSTRFGHFDHDYQFLAHPDLSQQLPPYYDTTATGPGKQNIFLQGACGVKAKLEFPDLLNWRDSNIVLNKAEMVFTVDRSNPAFFDSKLYPVPLKIFLEGESPTTGKPVNLIENIFAFGGSPDVNYRYTFNVPHTVGQIMAKKLDVPNFYVSVYQTAVFPHRLVLGGYANNAAPVKLKLWYTRLSFPK